MDKEDVLSGICADIVALKRLEPCLAKLRAAPKGVWQELSRVCSDDEALLQELEKLGTDGAATYATWLPFPDSVYGPSYITIMFFCESLHWYSLALFNSQSVGPAVE